MDIDFGQILPNPTDAAYDPTFAYSTMQTCIDDYKSEWMSLKDNNRGHALPGYNANGSAKKNEYWRCLVNIYRTGSATNDAIAKAELARQAAQTANAAAGNADNKAKYAGTQGDYAKEIAEHPTYIGDDNYVYTWSHDQQKYVKGAYMKGKDLDINAMTEEEKTEFYDKVAEAVTQDGGYILYPLSMDDISTTAVFKKNSIICIDGVVYRAVKQTGNLPVVLVVENNRFVTQQINGYTVFIKAKNSVSEDWDVWLDASSDFRYKSLEERVAHLETKVG